MDKKLIALLIALVSFAAVTFILNPHHKSGDMTFAEWKIEHGLMQDLSESEEQYRLKVYQENVRIINEHNSKLGKSYEMGINKFTAYTKEEFAFLYLSKFETPSSYDISMEPAVKSVGADVNWVSFGAVSPVKDQGQCTASYAFSAVGGIEGISVIYYRNQVEYSVQQVVDCSAGYGNNGCVSGNMVASFNYIAAKGINTWNSYPYAGKVTQCQVSTGFFKIKDYATASTCTQLDNALVTRPVSVAVDGYNFASYRSGIFDNCGTNVGLALLLVGMTDFYYNLKNSWGVNWGEGGYIRLIKKNNICGICLYPSFPLPA